MSKNFKKYLIMVALAAIFFITSFATLGDYGISWDEPIHFVRGQAYLHYFLTGEKTYPDINLGGRRSLYQDSSFTAEFFLKNDSGHPPINGILAAFFNYIFYQKLGILGDIESFHLFNILSATFLVFVVTLFAKQAYGNLAAFFAGLSIAVYPLFFGESHFNIKDPAETAFFTATIWAFWNALKKYNWRWLLSTILFFALALGTKFNILFLPFIIMAWLILRGGLKAPRTFLTLLLTAPFIIMVIFFLSWPYLWQDPLNNIFNIFRYYKDIGTGGLGQPQFITWGGFNLFPAFWIIITTPPIILVLTILGLLTVIWKRLEKEKTAFLWLFWLIIPILRVSLPGSSIYGGVRQIMEFLPAMALLAGLGATVIIDWLKSLPVLGQIPKGLLITLILVFFLPHLFVMLKMHPNENVYFNFLISGLPGAKKANIPYWGNSFGNAYYQAVAWLNKNALPGSKVALIQGTSVNIPKSYFSPNISYSNSFWSGINREGEYLVELTHQGNEIAYPFAWEYIKIVLIPVYEVSVEGVAIAKIWKNDLEHSRSEYKIEQILPITGIRKIDDWLEIEFKQVYALARLKIKFDPSGDCRPFSRGLVQTSLDQKNWRVEAEKIGDYQVKAYSSLENGLVQYIFPGNQAAVIRVKTDSDNSCLFNNYQIEVQGFRV